MKSRWRSRRALQASAALLLLQSGLVNAVSLTGCSTLNTGNSGGSSSTNMYMSNGKCSDSCQGYAFAITQDTNCWCSNYAPGDSTDVGSCSSPCPGYPYELCGNQGQGLFGYIALGKAPIGTQGGSSSTSSSSQPTSSSSSPSSSQDDTPQAPATSVATSVLVSTALLVPPPSTTPVTVVKTKTPSSSSTSSPIMSTALITLSGAVVTQVVTATAAPPATDNRLPQPTHTGLSDGAVAGATIGAILGAGLIGAAVFLLCWRKGRANAKENEGAISRNPSVLSRTGLLGSARSDAGGEEAAVGGTATLPTLPKLQTANQPLGFDPGSAATGDSSLMSEYKRFSRPLFVDSRLNPNAVMQHPNLSRTSIGTLQDNQDYSRPLEVRNPD